MANDVASTRGVNAGVTRTFDAVRSAGRWITAEQVAEASGLGMTVTRKYLRLLLDQGVLKASNTTPRYYRLSDQAPAELVGRFDEARAVFEPAS